MNDPAQGIHKRSSGACSVLYSEAEFAAKFKILELHKIIIAERV